MEIKQVLLKELLLITRDGEWGKGAPGDDLIEMSVIRGTDFEAVRYGNMEGVPTRYIPKHIAERKQLQANDIVIETAGGSKDRPTGRTLFLKQRLLDSHPLPLTCASFSRFLRVDQTLAAPAYVFWYLQFLYETGQMSQHQVQHTGVARFQYTRFAESTTIPLPPIQEQHAIAAVLGALDDKIELNRQMNQTLEAIGRAIFKSWFVDFDPVHARANDTPYPLDEATLALFPDHFEDSELGLIPAGWRVAPISNLTSAVRGLSYKGSGLSDSGTPLHNLNSVYEGGGYKYEGIKYYTGDYKEQHIVRPGDLIVTNTEQGFDFLLIGYAAIVPKHFGDFGLFSHHIYRIRPLPGSPLTTNYLCLLFQSPHFRGQVIGYTNGTTVNMLNIEGVKRPLLVVPPSEIVKRFEEIISPLFKKAELNYQESRTLAEVRDMLLPRLISGRLRVPVAEQMVEEVL